MTGGGAPAGRRPLRVAMVHYSDFRLDSRIQRQARALAARGDEVHLACLGDDDVVSVGVGRIHVHAMPGARASANAAAYLRGYGAFLAAATRRLTALDRHRRLDVVEIHNMPDALVVAGLLPRLRGVPVILNVHDTFPELFACRFGDRLARLARWEERLSAACTDAVITVTDAARDVLNERGVGAGRTTVVMNTPDESVFGPPAPALALPADGPLRVLYHGGGAERFGVATLIRAVGLLGERRPRVHLRVLAGGDGRPALQALAREVGGGRVDVAPAAVPFDQIPAELRRAHIGVVPTLANPFTDLLLPVKLMEYVHAGLPVVCSQLPGVERHFGRGELLFAPPGSPAALADALDRLCADPAAAQERARRATLRLHELRWEAQQERYLALVDRLAARPGRRGIRRPARALRGAAHAAPATLA